MALARERETGDLISTEKPKAKDYFYSHRGLPTRQYSPFLPLTQIYIYSYFYIRYPYVHYTKGKKDPPMKQNVCRIERGLAFVETLLF